MSLRISLLTKTLAVIMVFLSGCSSSLFSNPTETATVAPPTATKIPPTPTITPTATEIPLFVNAVVWSGELQVPILIYHRFVSDDIEDPATTKTHFSEFRAHLQKLYDNGFSLISLESWLSGNFVVPAGRKPLIITMDDLWSADQLFIDEDGTPSQYSGIGILWQFAQDNPDFGFSVSGFSNMGDKLFADTFRSWDERFIKNSEDNSPIWRDKLSYAMVWALENGVRPFNHTYTHAKLDITAPSDIQYQLAENDRVTRHFLTRVGREDLIPQLGNIIALPYGIWPSTQSGINVLKNYKNPEGIPVAAILEAYNLDAAQLTPSVFSAKFDRFKIQRITTSDLMIQFIVDHKDEIPSAVGCQVGPIPKDSSTDLDALSRAISETIQAGICTEGIYNIDGNVFIAKDGTVVHYVP